jgi:hypothetical protein
LAFCRDGWGEWKADQDWAIDLIRLGKLQQQFLRRLLEVWAVEHDQTVCASTGL